MPLTVRNHAIDRPAAMAATEDRGRTNTTSQAAHKIKETRSEAGPPLTQRRNARHRKKALRKRVRQKSARPISSCAIILNSSESLQLIAPAAFGTASIHTCGTEPRNVSFTALAAAVPSPDVFGDFDQYQAVLFRPRRISFVLTLEQIEPSTWAGSLLDIISIPITRLYRVEIRPENMQQGTTGEPILHGSFAKC